MTPCTSWPSSLPPSVHQIGSFYAQLNGSAQQVLSGAGAGLIFVNELVGIYARGVQ